MEGIVTKGIPHKKLRPILEKVRAKVRNHPIITDLFKENKLDPDEFDLIPMCFAKLDVSARTDHGVIYFNVDLAKDGFGKNDHYMVHEGTHWVDQCTGTKPTKGSDSGDYLKNPEEVEAFQHQVEYIDETKSKDKAEKYVEKVLDHHDVHDKKERKSRHDALMALASNSPEEIFAQLVEKIKKAKIADVEVIPGRESGLGRNPPKPYTPKLPPGEYSGKGAPLTREQRTELLSKMYTTKEISREKERKEIISQFIKKLPKEIKSSVKKLINDNIEILLKGNNDALNNLAGIQGRIRPQEENSWKYKVTLKFYYPQVGRAPVENKERETSFIMETPKSRGQNIEPKDDELDYLVEREVKNRFENNFNEIPTEEPITIRVEIESMGRAEFGFSRNRFLRLEFTKGFGIYNPRRLPKTHKVVMPAGTIGEKFPDLRERLEEAQARESRRQEIESMIGREPAPEEPEEDLEGQLPEVI